MYSTNPTAQLRLRVFAGPNGSGKSTVIKYVRSYKTKNGPIDFGYYINADDLATLLKNSSLSFNSFDIIATNKEFFQTALASGLINENFPENIFEASYTLRNNKITLKDISLNERLAQVVADFLRKKLLTEGKRFSFETVFSHESKLEIMKEARALGYKVYLYFVSTESPEINKARVVSRKAKGGHDVPEDLIEKRYYRSLELLFDACQIAYQAYFFDNSTDGKESQLFAHFKLIRNKKKWDKINMKKVPEWFKKYYAGKVEKG